jgi:hypothetical protein
MLKRFLVAHEDSLSMWEPAYVTATSPSAAVEEYLKRVYSKDFVFREHVLDLYHVDAFVGGLIYPTAEDQLALMEGVRQDTPERVQECVRKFFSHRPEFGEIFLNYLDTKDASIVSDDVYEYIAVRDPDGIIAIEEEKILTLA